MLLRSWEMCCFRVKNWTVSHSQKTSVSFKWPEEDFESSNETSHDPRTSSRALQTCLSLLTAPLLCCSLCPLSVVLLEGMKSSSRAEICNSPLAERRGGNHRLLGYKVSDWRGADGNAFCLTFYLRTSAVTRGRPVFCCCYISTSVLHTPAERKCQRVQDEFKW